ncbi:MAG: hypothetical protein HXX10_26495 [Rhodoplanes sp.]|uniref:hypothetical protein n=1 Tax=Rhodoplanes sp. TaxID=1968906 RepID=UPI0018299AED|nr:hypothetical protein [Rhodoplanes sp.]NVO17594.1 hypothetical protein [Rhodoplanes sp.]
MYKRNQVEWALWHAVAGDGAIGVEPVIQFVHTVKRLIDIDRKMEIDTTSREDWERRFAFLDGTPQGRGGENMYSAEAIVSLWIGIQLLAAGHPQTETIQFLRRLRPLLDKATGSLLREHEATIEEALRQKASVGERLRLMRYLAPDQRLYLVAETVSKDGVLSERTRKPGSRLSNLCAGREQLVEYIETYVSRSKRFAVVEIADAVLAIAYLLPQAEPVRRGRPG